MRNLSSAAPAPAPASSSELGQCSAIVPALGAMTRCADPAAVVERVGCEYGHEHDAPSCERHRLHMAPDYVGCIVCKQLTGRDVPLRLVASGA